MFKNLWKGLPGSGGTVPQIGDVSKECQLVLEHREVSNRLDRIDILRLPRSWTQTISRIRALAHPLGDITHDNQVMGRVKLRRKDATRRGPHTVNAATSAAQREFLVRRTLDQEAAFGAVSVKCARHMSEANHVGRFGRIVERKVRHCPVGDSPAWVWHSTDKFFEGQPELLLDGDDIGPGHRNGKGPTASRMTRIAQAHSLVPSVPANSARQAPRPSPIIVTIVAIDSDESNEADD